MLNNFDNLDGAPNAGGGPWFQVVVPGDIDTIPDVILKTIGSAITLNSGATAYNIKAIADTIVWNESTQDVNGRDVHTATCQFSMAKDRADLLEYSWHLYNKGVVAIVEDANAQKRLMGTKDEPATFRRLTRGIGTTGGGRNEHRYEITITSAEPIPFYEVSAHLPAPANVCPENPLVSIGVYSDSGHTIAISSGDFESNAYIQVTPSAGFIPTSYRYNFYNGTVCLKSVSQPSNEYTWDGQEYGDITIIVTATDGVTSVYGSFDFTVNQLSLVTDASTVARYSFEFDADLIFNGSNVSQINDLSGNGYHLTNASASQQPLISSLLSGTGRQYARFLSDSLNGVFAGGNYDDMTMILVHGCDGNSGITRVGSVVKTGESDFNGANSVAMQETRMEKSGANINGKYDRELSVLIYRIVKGVGVYNDFFIADGRQLSYSNLSASVGGIEYQEVSMARNNANGMNIAGWHFIGRKLTDTETALYGRYLSSKWNR